MKNIPIETIQKIEQHFHALIHERTSKLTDEQGFELPSLIALLESDIRREWFGVPGMYGGFSYWLVGEGEDTVLITESWSRILGGSGQRHEITAEGSKLVDEGFV